jgi:hypothetical protein
MGRRDPVFYSTVTAMPGESFPSGSSTWIGWCSSEIAGNSELRRRGARRGSLGFDRRGRFRQIRRVPHINGGRSRFGVRFRCAKPMSLLRITESITNGVSSGTIVISVE